MQETPKTQIALPHLIQVAVLLVSLASAYIVLREAVNAQARVTNDHEVRIRLLEREMTSSIATIMQRLINIEQAVKKN